MVEKKAVPAPRRIGRGAPKERGKSNTPRRTTSHKFRAQDFVRKRQNESLEDHYSVGKLLGEGQFGEVFIGTVKKSNGGKGDNRAIKRIQKELLTEEDHDEVFNEFNVLKGLDHPNIAKMFEFFEDQDSFWFVQELCSGGELLDELERTETFTEAAAALIMKQVLSSVNYCHTQKQVVHRDLKLENILLVEGAQKAGNGEAYNPMTCKVIDFGLATKFTEDQVLTSPVGSMHYIAPEVLEQEYGYKCDIWSCGVIAYILLCGYAPFEGANDRDMRELIMMGHVTYEDPIWKNSISQDAKDFVSYLLTYEPDKRPDAGQALQHEWIQKASKVHAEQFKATKSGTDAAVRVLSNIRSFEAASKLKQATCAFMTSQLVLSGDASDDEDAAENDNDNTNTAADSSKSTAMMIGEIFRAIDTDSDGQLSREELRLGFLDFLGESAGLTVEEVDDIFLRMDLAFTGFIDYSEFVVASMGLHDQEQAHHQVLLKQAFERLLDKDGSGFISHEKLRMEMAPFYGEDVEEHIIQKIIDQADADQDGQISWDDFQAMMSKTADFVPPENATPLSSHQKQKAGTPPASQPKSPSQAEKGEDTSKDATDADGKETTDDDDATKKAPSTVGFKSRSSAGPKARLISAMFEKNLEKNREMGFDKFTYTHQQQAAKAGGQKRKLPRTRRVNIDELTKKANTQVNFDPNAVKAGRNKEIEQLKSSPGMARQRRATIVNMFQQEKPEHRNRRESRLLELQSLKSPTDRREQVRNMWNKPQDSGLSKARKKAEELKQLQKAFDETDEAAPSNAKFEADEDNLDSSLKEQFAKQRPSMPWLPKNKSQESNVLPGRALRNSSHGTMNGTKIEKDNSHELDTASNCTSLDDLEEVSEHQVEPPDMETQKLELPIETTSSPPVRGRLASYDAPAQANQRLQELQADDEGSQTNTCPPRRAHSTAAEVSSQKITNSSPPESKPTTTPAKRNNSIGFIRDQPRLHELKQVQTRRASLTGGDEPSASPETRSPALSPVRTRRSAPNQHDVSPKDLSPFGPSIIPKGSYRGVRGMNARRATAPTESLGMTEAQAKFLAMANERAMKAKAKENEAANPQADETKTE